MPKHFSDVIADIEPSKVEFAAFETDGRTLKEMTEAMERQVVRRALARFKWNQSKTADALGLSRVGIANKIKRYGLDKGDAL